MKEILVDESGYEEFIDTLENLKKISLSNSSSGSEICDNDAGNGWHDNFDFEQMMRESRSLSKRIDDMLADKKYLKVIEPSNLGDFYVNINDTLLIEFTYQDKEVEEEKIKLTGKYIPNTKSNIKEITLNSPLGKTIYKKQVGSTLSYNINNNEVTIKIIKKLS